jgi:hypothetical protein
MKEKIEMTVKNQLPAKTAAQVPTTPGYESAAAYLNSGGMTVGRPIRFDGKNGKFVDKDDDAAISPDRDFVLIGDQAWAGHIKFHEDGAPEHIGSLISDPGFRICAREELGDNDPSLWPASKFGNGPEDPWKECIYVPLEDRATGELFTLQGTQALTTIKALKALLATYQRRAQSDPDHYPVIRLKVGTYEHRQFGTLPKPAFTIVGKAPKASTAKPNTSIGADMNDALPF